MIDAVHSLILDKTKAKKILKVQVIQKLWSNYGELLRITLENHSVIIKLINLPERTSHPRGWNSDISHMRKEKSYQVETTWYQNFNDPIQAAMTPLHIASGRHHEYQYLILEDLQNKGFTSKHSLKWTEIECCLSWLAHFHRTHLGQRKQGLWEIGTYWHLETRPEELEVLKDLELKEAAPLIDQKLNQAKFQTIVHGDAKLANFLFNNQQAAAVDFQYVGGGVGVKDLAYFMSSIFNEHELESLESRCLDYYFKILDMPEVEAEWRKLYPYAWCDFYRFLQGWSPGHPKINSYSEMMKERVLKCL